ncbi:MAG: (4Fe-4S)-binding protein [Chloroflexi bacterium]|nr:MAG: (4Fe-4S)-binding protein [Chloroflexota bacterium]
MPEPLPVKSKTPRAHSNKWVLVRKLTQTVSLILFILTLLFSRSSGLIPDLVKLPIRLSPLAMFSELLSSKTLLLGSTLSLIVFLSSLVVGRAWCGWLCPLGTILDIFAFSKKKSLKEPMQVLRNIKYGLLFITILSALFGNLTLLFFDPITIFIRSSTMAVLPVIDKMIYSLEKLLIKIPFMAEPVFTFDAWLRPLIFPVESSSYQYALLWGSFFIAIVLLNVVVERFWCRYLCPLGAMLGLPSKLSLVQRRVKSTCAECGVCKNDCPTGTIDSQNNYRSDPSECTMCMNCLEGCQKNSLSFSPKWQPAPFQSYDPNRRLFLSSLGVSVLAVALLSIDWIKKHPKSFFLRPPGVIDNEDFLSKCVRCGVCIKVCPTQALQADANLSGLEGFGTPILIPRIGFCAFSCNACGQHCPVEAIPPLLLAEKRVTKLGHAYIDQNRCLAWSDHLTCIVCEEMCPIPQKAISLESGSFSDLEGRELEVQLPIVDREKCIGCGICENKCPVTGEAAIRVYTL